MDKRTWSDRQVNDIVKMIENQYGSHWEFIPETMRSPIVSHAVLSTIIGSSPEPIAPADIADLRRRVFEKAFPPA